MLPWRELTPSALHGYAQARASGAQGLRAEESALGRKRTSASFLQDRFYVPIWFMDHQKNSPQSPVLSNVEGTATPPASNPRAPSKCHFDGSAPRRLDWREDGDVLWHPRGDRVVAEACGRAGMGISGTLEMQPPRADPLSSIDKSASW